MVIPGNEEKPEGYITVTFDKGAGEKLEGQDKFYVLKDKMIDLTAKAPTAIPKAGYKFLKWDKALKQVFTEDVTVNATYRMLSDVEPGDTPEPPTVDYVKVTFKAGDHGSISAHPGFYVKRNTHVFFDTSDLPETVPDEGYKFSGWSRPVYGVFNKDTVITAEFKALKGDAVSAGRDRGGRVLDPLQYISYHNYRNGLESLARRI